jgi:DNA-directed RNA polymerase specialized sigma subunit
MTRDDLEKTRQLREELSTLEREYQVLLCRAEYKTPSWDNEAVQSMSFDFDRIQVEIADVSRKKDQKAKEFETRRQNTERELLKIKPKLSQDILRYRYIKGYSWETIAIILNYSERHVLRIHTEIMADL